MTGGLAYGVGGAQSPVVRGGDGHGVLRVGWGWNKGLGHQRSPVKSTCATTVSPVTGSTPPLGSGHAVRRARCRGDRGDDRCRSRPGRARRPVLRHGSPAGALDERDRPARRGAGGDVHRPGHRSPARRPARPGRRGGPAGGQGSPHGRGGGPAPGAPVRWVARRDHAERTDRGSGVRGGGPGGGPGRVRQLRGGRGRPRANLARQPNGDPGRGDRRDDQRPGAGVRGGGARRRGHRLDPRVRVGEARLRGVALRDRPVRAAHRGRPGGPAVACPAAWPSGRRWWTAHRCR